MARRKATAKSGGSLGLASTGYVTKPLVVGTCVGCQGKARTLDDEQLCSSCAPPTGGGCSPLFPECERYRIIDPNRIDAGELSRFRLCPHHAEWLADALMGAP